MAQAPLINPFGSSVELNMAPALTPFQASNFAVGTAGAAAVVTADADADRPNIIRQIWCSYDAAPTGGGIKIEDGSGTVVWQQAITAAGEHELSFELPKSGTKNTAMIVTLLAPGGSVVGRVYADIYRQQ